MAQALRAEGACDPVYYHEMQLVRRSKWTRGRFTGFLTPGATAPLGPAVRDAGGPDRAGPGRRPRRIWPSFIDGAIRSGEREAAPEALMRVLRADGATTSSASTSSRRRYTDVVGSIADRALVRRAMQGVDAVLHAATLHKPHVGSHTPQEFVDTNVTGTLNLLEEAVAAGASRLRLHQHDERVRARADARRRARPPAWITEDVAPGPAQHLRRDQDRGRGPVRARAPRPRPARA